MKKKFNEKILKKAAFCRNECPGCTKGRAKGSGLLYQLMKIERLFCPYCRAYEKVYGVRVYEEVAPAK